MHLIPTQEQQAILEAKEDVIVVDSRAGTGKTTEAILIAKANPDKRILYLVFNKSQKEQAKEKFPSNAAVHTVHSFSWACGGGAWGNNLGNFSVAIFLDTFELPALATLTHQFLVFFMNTPEDTLTDTVPSFLAYLNDYARVMFTDNLTQILDVAKETLFSWYDKEIPCPHDFYLKISYIKRWVHHRMKSFDILILDEGQDLTRISLDMAQKFSGRVFLIGDRYQQLYAWRFAINAMDYFEDSKKYHLTKSFRFGPKLAKIATTWIQESLEPDFIIHGNEEVETTIGFKDGLGSFDQDTAILHRTNLGIFSTILSLRNREIPYRFERDLSPVLYRVLDIQFLKEHKMSKVRDEFIKEFSGLEELEEYANEMEDYSLLSLISLVNTYSFILPDVIFKILKEIKAHRRVDNAVTLSTVHSAKGCEYKKVYLEEDLADVFSIESRDKSEEYNTIYVGLTRAINELYLPLNLGGVLTPKWDYIMSTLMKLMLKTEVISPKRNIDF